VKKISRSQLPRAYYCCSTAAARVQESQAEIDVLSFFLSFFFFFFCWWLVSQLCGADQMLKPAEV
jgi:hypothetical protein